MSSLAKMANPIVAGVKVVRLGAGSSTVVHGWLTSGLTRNASPW